MDVVRGCQIVWKVSFAWRMEALVRTPVRLKIANIKYPYKKKNILSQILQWGWMGRPLHSSVITSRSCFIAAASPLTSLCAKHIESRPLLKTWLFQLFNLFFFFALLARQLTHRLWKMTISCIFKQTGSFFCYCAEISLSDFAPLSSSQANLLIIVIPLQMFSFLFFV